MYTIYNVYKSTGFDRLFLKYNEWVSRELQMFDNFMCFFLQKISFRK